MAVSISCFLIAAICSGFGSSQVLPFSDADKQSAVDVHNQYRIAAGATAMQKLKWNDELAQFAQNTASRCTFKHTSFESRQNVGGFSYIGESIYTITGPNVEQPSIKKAIDDWASEEKDYNLYDNSCRAMCGHYTQIVWAATTDVGCAISKCANVYDFNNQAGYIIFCNYGIGGNMMGEKPFEKASSSGDVGSKCQDKFKNSADGSGLCSGDGASSGDGQSVTDAPITDTAAPPTPSTTTEREHSTSTSTEHITSTSTSTEQMPSTSTAREHINHYECKHIIKTPNA